MTAITTVKTECMLARAGTTAQSGSSRGPIPRTGICKSVGRRNTAPGFTLMEILVVLLIISIVSGFAIITLSANRHSEAARKAQQLANEIRLAEQEALLRPATIGMQVLPHTVKFEISDQARPDANGLAWRKLLSDSLIPPVFHLSLSLQPDRPVLITPDGGLTPFVLLITNSTGEPVWRITGKSTGEVTVDAAKAG